MSENTASKETLTWELGLFAPSVSQLNLDETAALLHKMDYKWVGFRLQTEQQIASSPWGRAFNTLVLDHLLDDAKQVGDLLKSKGLKVATLQVDAPEDFPKLHSVVREAAQMMGCANVILFSPPFDVCMGFNSQKSAFQAQIGRWVDEFKDTGIRLCLETHFSSITPSAALTVSMLEPFSPAQTGVVWDPANTVFEGYEIPQMALDIMGDYLAEVHLKNGEWKREEDGKWVFNFCDLSQGILQWPALLKMIDERGYAGPLIVEDYRWMDPEAKLANARAEYNQALASVAEIE